MFLFRMKMSSVFRKTTLSVAFLFMGLTLCIPSANSDVIPPHSTIYENAKNLSLSPSSAVPLYTHQSSTEPYDPLEPFNRVVFEFNRVLEGLLFNPLVHIYRGVVPPFVQKRIHCVLNNLATPVYFLNDVLQCKLDRACESLTRFIINTTFGLLGLFDVASEVDLPPHTEDLGQTLATWGADPGPYLVLPIWVQQTSEDFLAWLEISLLIPSTTMLFTTIVALLWIFVLLQLMLMKEAMSLPWLKI